MLFLFVFFICICSSCITAIWYMRQERVPIQEEKIQKIQSDFPQYDGMNSRKILVEMNATYPQYSVEIVSDTNQDNNPLVSDLTTEYREDRVRIYVNRSGTVQRSVIG